MRKKFRIKVFVSLLMAAVFLLSSCGGVNTSDASETAPDENPPRTGFAFVPLDIVAFIGENVASGIASSAGSEGFGWVLNLVGLGDPVADQTIKMLEQINSQIIELKDKITALQQQLNYVDYNTLAGPLQNTVSAILAANQLLISLSKLPPVTENTTEAEKESRQTQIDNICTIISGSGGILANKNAISNAMLGTGAAGGGMIVKWSKAVVGRQRFFNKESSDAQKAMYDFWFGLQAIQEQLIVDYMHYMEYPQQTIEDEFVAYNTTRNAQRALLPWELPTGEKVPEELILVPFENSALMIDTSTFATRGKMKYVDALTALDEINRNSPYENWEMPLSTAITKFSSDEVEAMFKDAPKTVYTWAVSQGWNSFPDNASAKFSFWTDRRDDNPSDRIIYLYDKNHAGLDLALNYEQYHLLPMRKLPIRDNVKHQGEFYFYT